MVTAIVHEWSGEERYRALDSSETPGICFGCCTGIQTAGFRTLPLGQQVDLAREVPDSKQDGHDYRAVSVLPRSV
jgi:CspA family cold shock protein